MTWLDAAIVAAVLAAVTWAGHRLSGSISDRSSFFQADGTLPWWAVSASIIATLVSSVTFVSVPAAVFRDGGNLTYFQVVVGLAVGKFFIAWLLARPYYESQKIHTTYEYIGARMDRLTGNVSMWLGLALVWINSGIKLLTASLVLDVITGWGLAECAAFVMVFSLLWSSIAGIRTVIWTDFLLFVLFALGAVFAVAFIALQIDQSLGQAYVWLDQQAKLILFDFSTDPTVRYTLWSAILGSIGLSIALGATQGTWQRVRACRSVGDAYRAYVYSALFYVMHLFILVVGLGLVVFYQENPLAPSVLQTIATEPDRIFPHFIVTEIPIGISGLFIAAIFAAAISTLDSALTEAADLTVRHVYEPLRPAATEAHYVAASRWSLVAWSVLFWGAAVLFSGYTAEGLLDLTFKLPNYLYGAIFATIILARVGIGSAPSFFAGLGVAFAVVAWLASNDVAFFYWCPASGLAMIVVVLALERSAPEWSGIVNGGGRHASY